MNKTREFLRLSFIEGFFYALMVSTSESFALFYSVKLGLGHLQLAVITTMPLLFAAIAQWIIPRKVGGKSLPWGILMGMFVQLLGLLGLLYSSYSTFGSMNSLTYSK